MQRFRHVRIEADAATCGTLTLPKWMPTGRAVTPAHERAHTALRANAHPDTGDQPFCVAPHLGDPNVTTSNQALANPYGYEWSVYSMQPNYNPGKHRGPECGT
jgi:hypothetical protein